MKKILKSRIFLVIVTAIVFSTIGVTAATLISSSDVTYKNTTAKAALDDLYTKVATMYTKAEYDAKTPQIVGYLHRGSCSESYTVPSGKKGYGFFFASIFKSPDASIKVYKNGSLIVQSPNGWNDNMTYTTLQGGDTISISVNKGENNDCGYSAGGAYAALWDQ